MTPTAAELPVEGVLPSSTARRVAQFTATDAGGPARKSRPDRLLDLHLHQLAALAAVCSRVGREIKDRGLVVFGVHSPEFGSSETSMTFAAPRKICGSTIRSRSTATMRYGVPSGTSIGGRSISSMRRGM